jgi:hypothetical protein
MSADPDVLESQVSYVLTPGTNGSSIKPYAGRTIEVSFLSDEPVYSGATAFAINRLATDIYGDSTFKPMSEALQLRVQAAFAAIEKVANVKFVYTDTPSEGAIRLGLADVRDKFGQVGATRKAGNTV